MPDGQRLYAVGDIHGCLDQLESLLARIIADDSVRDPAETTLLLLGDVIDRGHASAQVVDLLLSQAPYFSSVRCLMGNHEEVFVRLLSGDLDILPFFLNIGGDATLASYGLPNARDLPAKDVLAFIDLAVPSEHRAFFDSMENVVVFGDYAFVHAGVQPSVPIDEQDAPTVRWIREEFLRSRKDHGKVIVHGHTISDDVVVLPNRIGIDTGAYMTGLLTALGLEGTNRWFLQSSAWPGQGQV